jgi:hypothetical protein
VQVPPPVEVMRTVEAVTEPLVAAGPKAETQSPTARSPDVTDWVVLTGVELDVVTFTVSVLGFVGFLFLLLDVRDLKLPPEIEMPETVSVVPLTAVTLPEAMLRLANCLAKFPPEPPLKKLGRVPLPLPVPPGPPRTRKPPAGGPPEPVPARKLPAPPAPTQAPLLDGVVTVIARAAMVVLDFFDADPVAVTQSPTVTELTVSVTLLENVVVVVQFTVVWPLLGFCTSMLDPLSAATLPVAPMGAAEVVAAPAEALDPSIPAARRAAAPVPRVRAQPRLGVRRSVGVSMVVVASFIWVRCFLRAGFGLFGTECVDRSE